MYYGSGHWVRRDAGQEAVFQAEQLEVVTNMTADTYTPLVSWTVHQVRMSSLPSLQTGPLSLVEDLHYCALIGRGLPSVACASNLMP